MRIVNTTFSFIRPSVISIDQYLIIKDRLRVDPTFSLNNKVKLCSYIISLKYSAYGMAVGLVLKLISIDSEGIVGGLSLVTFLTGIFFYWSSISSFLEFLKEKKRYFIKLKSVIISSQSYSQFCIAFYSQYEIDSYHFERTASIMKW